jgi:hypothetical protein
LISIKKTLRQAHNPRSPTPRNHSPIHASTPPFSNPRCAPSPPSPGRRSRSSGRTEPRPDHDPAAHGVRLPREITESPIGAIAFRSPSAVHYRRRPLPLCRHSGTLAVGPHGGRLRRQRSHRAARLETIAVREKQARGPSEFVSHGIDRRTVRRGNRGSTTTRPGSQIRKAESGGHRNSNGPISSIGFAKPKRLRGRSLSSVATQSRSRAL